MLFLVFRHCQQSYLFFLDCFVLLRSPRNDGALYFSRHCEPRSGEAIYSSFPDCFAFQARNDENFFRPDFVGF